MDILSLSDSLKFVLKCKYNYCHMATNMVQLPYGNERELNDGRRTSSTPQRTWLEPAQAETSESDIPLCSEMEEGRDLHCIFSPVAAINRGRGAEEDRGCVSVAHIFSVASQLSAYRLEPGSAPNCYLLLPHVYYSVLWQQISTAKRHFNGQGVAVWRETSC